jgi:hypothetical protein
MNALFGLEAKRFLPIVLVDRSRERHAGWSGVALAAVQAMR